MTEKDAQDILEMIQDHWKRYYGAPTKDLWLAYLVEQDAEITTKAVAKLAEEQNDSPTINDLRQVIRMIQGEALPAIEPGVCPTCGGDKFVTVATRPPAQSMWMRERGIEVPDRGEMDEMAPCPDCNAGADASFRRGTDGSLVVPPDADRVREMLRG